ncbi:uncharacterized protein LOC128961373 [Oppia nitens]|uniref:uncharacterized protein LOC128961373 n=1 Tax=Oppia nitens TaxID=1686743 RepID=UPI0023DA043B|nr:uncharacterized protein LOC128961373 [Oppia nitens]
MCDLYDKVECLTREKQILLNTNEELIARHEALEIENRELKERLSEMSQQCVKSVEESDCNVESAELINVSQPQKLATIATKTDLKAVSHSMMPFISWLTVLNLIQCFNSFSNVHKIYSTLKLQSQTMEKTVKQENQLSQTISQSQCRMSALKTTIQTLNSLNT